MNDFSEQIQKLPSLRLTVEAHGLMAKKALGQNFLLDSNITDKIIRTSLERQGLRDFGNGFVWEIGPGPGGLTRSILSACPRQLTVIEMDERCIAVMEEIREKTGNCLKIVNGDALKYNIADCPETPQAHRIKPAVQHLRSAFGRMAVRYQGFQQSYADVSKRSRRPYSGPGQL